MSALTLTVVGDLEALELLCPEWEDLARQGGGAGAFFRSPAWLLPWWRAYHGALGAELLVLAVREGRDLIGMAPFYQRAVRLGPGVRTREIRLMGDAGPRPPALDLLVRTTYDEAFGCAVSDWLVGDRSVSWDVMDLMPLRSVSRARAFLAERLSSAERYVHSHESSSALTATLSAAAIESELLPPADPSTHECATDADIARGLAALRRLSRLEWASREEGSPLADAESSQLLGEVLRHGAGRARLCRTEDAHGETRAVALLVDDAPRTVCLALAVDPEASECGNRLLASEARQAALRGMQAMDIVLSAAEVAPPPVPITQRSSLRLRVFNHTAAGKVARTVTSLRRRAEAALEAPGAAAAGARSAWTRIRGAAGHIAAMQRLHLYRGELYVRGVELPESLEVRELAESDFDAFTSEARQDVASRLELDEAYCREKWGRGDTVLYATLSGQAIGIAWCARSHVYVPELAREVRPGAYECYIHDVFVAHDARGRGVAPVMLEALARRLRQRDVYRAWALIAPDNVASTRAFEKAGYASVADVIHARMAVVDKLVLRPPDSDGRRLLGLS